MQFKLLMVMQSPFDFIFTVLYSMFLVACVSHIPLGFEFEFIGVLRHMQRYFSHICDGTDVQAD